MCYSAEVVADYKKFLRQGGAILDLKSFYTLYWRKANGGKVKTPRAMDMLFAQPANEEEAAIKALVDRCNAAETSRLEQALFAQRKRLADAERKLAAKHTKSAAESARIAADKVQWALGKLTDLRRPEWQPQDSRIFPMVYAPVLVMEGGRRVIQPMRYQCRVAGKPASHDVRFPGTYNARRDNLEGFWRAQFGSTHAVLIATAFFENVKRHRMEGRQLEPGEAEENVVLEFRPRHLQEMLVACLWSRWSAPGEPDLLSFAVVTDEPPPEVAAAGHDRCVIPLKPGNLEAWLDPGSRSLADQHRLLDDRLTPYYEHRMAA